MKKLGAVAAAVAAIILIIAIAMLLSTGAKPMKTISRSTVPILLYGKGLPYTLYNLSSNLSMIVGNGNFSSSFNYSNFKPVSLLSRVMYAASLNKSLNSTGSDLLIKSPKFYFEGENNSFGNGSISLPLQFNGFNSANAVVLGLRAFPLAYYSSYPEIALRGALYPVYYRGNLSGIGQWINNESTPGILQYNISRDVPVTFEITNTSSGYILNVNVTNEWNRTLNLTEIEVVGYFLGSESSSFTLPRVNVVSDGDAYALATIGSLGIDMNLSSTQSYLQTNASSIGKLVDEADSGAISSSGQFYSVFNSTLNVSRLNYLESLMLENQSYYIAMHELDNFDPLNGSVTEYAGRLSAWENAYHGMLDFNVSSNGILAMPRSSGALGGGGLTIGPGGKANLIYNLGNLSYTGQSAVPIKSMNYTLFAYFGGVLYSDQANT
ncbi:MAG: hypothetical protein QXR73_01315 [Candidatus Micrarchaeaceae archaeon]